MIENGRAVGSSDDAASEQQLMDGAATEEKVKRTTRLPPSMKRHQDQAHDMAGAEIVSLLILMVAFSITTSSSSPLVTNYSSLSDGSGDCIAIIRSCLHRKDRSNSKAPKLPLSHCMQL